MTKMWGIHSDRPELDWMGNGFISIGWDDLGDLTVIGADKDAMKAAVKASYPNYKPGAIPVVAGTLLRFLSEMSPDDLVVYPHKPDSTLSFGRIKSPYYFDAQALMHKSRRDVEWIKTGVPRTEFSQSALYEIGSAVTLFRVKSHAAEFESFLGGTPTVVAPEDNSAQSPELAVANAEDEPNASRIEEHTADFIIKTLLSEISTYEFEQFVAHLLECMGYLTQVTVASGDGGVDVIAHRDPLGLEPPIIKVQCKRSSAQFGGPEVQKLLGTLVPGRELGLFVSLGSYSKDAAHIERSRQDLRLITGRGLVALILKHYEQFSSKWKGVLPLRAVYVVDRAPET